MTKWSPIQVLFSEFSERILNVVADACMKYEHSFHRSDTFTLSIGLISTDGDMSWMPVPSTGVMRGDISISCLAGQTHELKESSP